MTVIPRKSWLVFVVLLLVGCSRNDDERITGPGGSKSPNAFVQGSVTCEGCTDPAGVTMTIFSINPEENETGYSWHPVDSTVTDSTGQFAFDDSLESGEYSITGEKSGYEGFSGYFTIIDEDSLYTVDPIELQPTISIMGMFQFFNRNSLLVSLVGTDSANMAHIVVADSTGEVDNHRYFAFDAIAPAEYYMNVVIDYQEPTEMIFTLPFDMSRSLDGIGNTVYSDTLNGIVTTAEIDYQSRTITMYADDIFKLICFYVVDQVSAKAAIIDIPAFINERLRTEVLEP